MIRIKISTNFSYWPLQRQTPGGAGVWRDSRYFVNQDVEECDFWVVLDGLERPETARCHPSNTLLVTCEPPGVKTYSPQFVEQFGALLTSDEALTHRRAVIGQQGLPWMIGAHLDPQMRTWSNFMSFEEIESYSSRKTALVSVVASKDKGTAGHAARDKFVEELMRSLASRVDIFGLGYRPIVDKLDAIGPYRYHIAIENSCVPHYWTEKLADAFLGRAFPIYSGCPDLGPYFPVGSYERIDIADARAAANRVRDIVDSDIDKLRQLELGEARRRVLYEHNLFAMLDGLVPRLLRRNPEPARPLTLIPQSTRTHRGANGHYTPAKRLMHFIRRRRKLG